MNTMPEKVQRVFDLYVEQLVGEADTLDEELRARIRWLAEDAENVAKRLEVEPHTAVSLVASLSRIMQEIDHAAGASQQAHEIVKHGRRWALLLPDSTINEEGFEEDGDSHEVGEGERVRGLAAKAPRNQ